MADIPPDARPAPARGARWDGLGAAYDFLLAPLDRLLIRPWRRRAWEPLAAAGADDLVLEVGAGTGRNADHIPDDVRVVAVDLSGDMLRRAGPRGYRMRVVADAERLPFRDATFDGGAETLVWCEVPRPVRALAEVRRVLRPGAIFTMFDHVRPRGSAGVLADLLSRITGPWCGEWWNRDTRSYPAEAGFRIRRQREGVLGAVRLMVLEPARSPRSRGENANEERR